MCEKKLGVRDWERGSYQKPAVVCTSHSRSCSLLSWQVELEGSEERTKTSSHFRIVPLHSDHALGSQVRLAAYWACGVCVCVCVCTCMHVCVHVCVYVFVM